MQDPPEKEIERYQAANRISVSYDEIYEHEPLCVHECFEAKNTLFLEFKPSGWS